MKTKGLALLIFALVLGTVSIQAQYGYQEPSQPMIDLVDGASTPSVSISPDGTTMLLLSRPGRPSIEDVSQPELRLAGVRINPRTNGPSRSRSMNNGITIRDMKSGKDIDLKGLPANPKISDVSWSPKGDMIAFLVTTDSNIELWKAEISTANASRIGNVSVNDTYGSAFTWTRDGSSLIVKMVPENRGTAPVQKTAPLGPVIQESVGKAAPARTYQDLLANKHDEDLFDFYFTSQIAEVSLNGTVKKLGSPGIYRGMSLSPNGEYILTTEIHKPYSYRVPAYRFPNKVAVWNRDGKQVHLVADLPLADQIPIGFSSVSEGPRSISWRADEAATLTWVEALDGGDQYREVEKRDRVYMQKAPFNGQPEGIIDLEFRYAGISWAAEGFALINESWRSTRRGRTWLVDPAKNRKELIFDRSTEDRYSDPGSPEFTRSKYGTYVLHTIDKGRKVLMTGQGYSPEGNMPFLREFDLQSKKTKELWRAKAPYYEYVVSVLDDKGSQIITRRESVNEQPNYYQRNLKKGDVKQLTFFKHPTPELKDVTKEFITYKRSDGVNLSATVYLPPGYDKERDGKLPTLVWAYPREFKSAAAASQVTSSPYRFANISHWGPHFMLLEGYAVVEGAAMPIIGEGDQQPNDTFVEQLVANGQAIVDELDRRGVSDPERVGVGGHSYGAFMTANLLAHSDIFRAGIARSGAYNRSLTPFGFQAEPRTFWEAPEIYFTMSPFMNADKVDEPILFIHGEADNNSGTFPMQSKRMYSAISGLGGIAKLVMLPNESHGYVARESLLHMLFEQTNWLNKYVKNAESRPIQRETKPID
ncbi:prolyl oligopeptidase family serine peptidase [Balneola vulgaris]|uniref:S9 family peptidase n=1 Tax=Balneola vulgaris TaxID=287535 RepID=UPI0003730E81|nr:prolyl oligopeptidase family serine peptidase [Balneola vulgaris]